jgi:hypothetical protein
MRSASEGGVAIVLWVEIYHCSGQHYHDARSLTSILVARIHVYHEHTVVGLL